MPPRSKEEKERRRALHKQKQEERKQNKAKAKASTTTSTTTKQQHQHDNNDNNNHNNHQTEEISNTKQQEKNNSKLLEVPEDALELIFCYLPSKELGLLSMCCLVLNECLYHCRITHFLSRLNGFVSWNNHNNNDNDDDSDGVRMQLAKNELEAREWLSRSIIGGGNTGRLITKKSKRNPKSADEYIAYARFIEETISAYAIQSFGGKKTTSFLAPIVNGRFASVSPEHSLCRIGGDGEKSGAGGSGVAAWGVGRRGQLGHGKREDIKYPFRLRGGIGYGIRIVQVSAGGGLVRVAHSLLLTSTGRVLSFGTASHGQLGHGYDAGKQLSDTLRPRYITTLPSHIRCTCVAAGELHSAVVSTDGDVYTWGDGFCGQLGLGNKRPQLTPMQVTCGDLEDEFVISVCCGNRHTICITEDGDVFTFGLGYFGVLGRNYTPFEYDADAAIAGLVDDDNDDNDNDGAQQPQPPPPPAAVAATAAATTTNYNMTEETRAHLDLLATLTLDDKSDQCIPKRIDMLDGIHIVGASAGHRHSIVLDNKGGVYTFGSGTAGALGHGNLLKQSFPMKVLEFDQAGIQIMQISAGVDISMAVSTQGIVYSWGKASDGRIGLGMCHGNVTIPRPVLFPTTKKKNKNDDDDDNKNDDDDTVVFKAVDVECGYVHSIIVGLDGTIHVCGGVGIDGELDGQKVDDEDVDIDNMGKPMPIPNFNIWHRIPEPKDLVATKERWKKYGKYELKGRSKMMAETSSS